MNFRREQKKYKKDLLMILTTNWCAKRFMEENYKELLATNTDELRNELSNLRNWAVQFETKNPDKTKWKEKEKEESQKIRDDMQKANGKIEQIERITGQIRKFTDAYNEAVFIYKNADLFFGEVEEKLNE